MPPSMRPAITAAGGVEVKDVRPPRPRTAGVSRETGATSQAEPAF